MSDVLVIGSGAAGLTAALNLAERFNITHVTVQAELAGAHGGVVEDKWGASEAGHADG